MKTNCACSGLGEGMACPLHPEPSGVLPEITGPAKWNEIILPTRAPISGTRLSDPFRLMPGGLPGLRANAWFAGVYLLYQRGIEYFRPNEHPAWLIAEVQASGMMVGPLPCYRDEATGELVPVLIVPEARV